MSLTTLSTGSLVRKQFQYRMRAYIGVITPLIILQVIAIGLSLLGNGGMSSSGGYGITVSVRYYSSDIVFAFTILWAFINAILITTKAYRYDDFTFVTSRFTANISNVLFLAVASVFGGITAVLSGYVIKIYIYFFLGSENVIGLGANLTSKELIIGIVAASLMIFLFSAIGYVIGKVIQISKLFIFLLPVFAIALFTAIGIKLGVYPLIPLSEFYFQEASFLLFFLKVIITSFVLFLLATMISNRMEVKK